MLEVQFFRHFGQWRGKHSLMEVIYSVKVRTKTRSDLPHRSVTRRARDAGVEEGRESVCRGGRATIPSRLAKRKIGEY